MLSLTSVTFDSAGTYICEASTPTVPLLSRTQSFKLLVQGLRWGWGQWQCLLSLFFALPPFLSQCASLSLSLRSHHPRVT
jgi:hypothetical protein